MKISQRIVKSTLTEARQAWYDQDIKKAASLFRKAALEGSAEACHALGIMYLESIHFYFDKEKAEKYLLMAAERGYAPAQRDLGYVYFTGMFNTMELNREKAEKWLAEAVKRRDLGAIAYCYYYGLLGRKKDPWMFLKIMIQHYPSNIPESMEVTSAFYACITELGYDEDNCISMRDYTFNFHEYCPSSMKIHRYKNHSNYDYTLNGLHDAAERKNPEALFLYAGRMSFSSEIAIPYYMEAARLGHRKAIQKMENFWKRVAQKAKDYSGTLSV